MKMRRILLAAVFCTGATLPTGEAVSELETRNIDSEIDAYFPSEPRFNGEAGTADFKLRSYEYTDEKNIIVYTAQYQVDPHDFDGQAPTDTVRDYVDGQAISVSGRVIDFEAGGIGDASAQFLIEFRYGEATMRKFAVVALDEGRLKQWAVQDIPGYSLQDAEEIFEQHVNAVRF